MQIPGLHSTDYLVIKHKTHDITNTSIYAENKRAHATDFITNI